MKPLPIKKIIFKSFSLPIKEFDNFINIVIVPYVIILPFHLYVIYYDDFVLRMLETEGFYKYWMGSLRTQIINYLLIFPIFLVYWQTGIDMFFLREKNLGLINH